MSRGDLNASRWLDAHSDRNAALTTFPGNAVLSDVSGDGDHRLILTDVKLETDKRSRLKIYKGSLLTTDQVLPETPSSIITFYTDNLDPRIPAVAVACGVDLLIYKNTKPFYKFTIPACPLEPLEEDVWNRLNEGDTAYEKIFKELKTINFNRLSARSQMLLTLPSREISEYVARFSGLTPMKNSVIVCMGTINRSEPEKGAVSCPVLCTENGIVYVLDPQTFAILHQANICNLKTTPTVVKTSGMFEVEFRIVVACRENNICVLRRGWLEGKCIIQITENIVDLVLTPGDNFIIIATTNKMLHCYTKRGQRVWSSLTINPITCLCLVPLKHLSTHLVAVGLKGGFVHLYHGRQPVDYINTSDTPSTLTFGQLGQEEHVLIIITISGAINFKILKRTADFNLSNQDKISTPISHSKPLPLPKRSKLFLEQSLRERQNPVEMHQNFQQDLVRLRLTAAKSLVQNLNDQSGAGNPHEQIKLSAQVLGLGPYFTLVLSLENMNNEKAIHGFSVVFHTSPKVYTLDTYTNFIPLVPPGLSFKIQAKVREILQNNDEGVIESIGKVIRVFLLRKGQAHPVLAASINMPPTEITTLL